MAHTSLDDELVVYPCHLRGFNKESLNELIFAYSSLHNAYNEMITELRNSISKISEDAAKDSTANTFHEIGYKANFAKQLSLKNDVLVELVEELHKLKALVNK